MRVAIIGEPGTGKSTLARVLAVQLGVTPVCSVEELRGRALEDAIVLDGVPFTLTDLTELGATAVGKRLDHVLHLRADFAVRVDRVSRRVRGGANAAEERNRLLSSPVVEVVAERLALRVPVTVVDANRSRSEVLAAALGALGLTWR